MKRVKFIYFDVGGVILYFDKAYKTISEKTGKSTDEVDEIFDKYSALGKNDTNKILEDYKRELGLCFDTYYNFVLFYTNLFIPIKETHELIKKISNNYLLGLFSNTEPGVLETSIAIGKIPNVSYKVILASCYVGCLKPDSKIYVIAQEKADCEPSEILFVDDKVENLEPAKKMGWQTFLFNYDNPEDSVASIKKYLENN